MRAKSNVKALSFQSCFESLPRSFLVPAVAFAVSVFLPLFLVGYWVSLLSFCFLYISFAQSWNIISGYSGYWSFGHQTFFGIGAYAVAILVTRHAFNPYVATGLAGVIALLAAVPLGMLLLRIRGAYFTISSLVIAEILKVVAVDEEWLTGGGNGVILPPVYALHSFYYCMLISMVSVTLVAYVIKRKPIGYALFAIRDDEDAAESYGINPTKYKLLVFAVSAFFVGILGGCYAWFLTYIDPYSSFDSNMQLLVTVATIFGGLGTVGGPIIGGFVYTLILELLWVSFPYVYLVILGVSLVLIIRFLPNGVLGYLETSERFRGLIHKPLLRGQSE